MRNLLTAPAANPRTAVLLLAVEVREDLTMTPKTKAALWFAGFVVLLGAGGFAYEQYEEAYPPEHRIDPDTPEARRSFAADLAMRTHGGVYTEGASDQGLVVDLNDCDYANLQALVHQRGVAQQLAEMDFAWVRCTNGVRVDGPW